MHKVANVESLIFDLKSMLPDYLREHGIDTNKKFTCLNPDHNDKNPSMDLSRNNLFTYCWSCHTCYDIFSVAHVLENKPLEGAKFILENVLYLANKYSIPVELDSLTESEMDRVNAYRAYEIASQYVQGFWDGYDPEKDTVVAAEIAKRQCTIDELKWLGVGFVRDFKDFNATMLKHGFAPQFLDTVDLSHRVTTGGQRRPNPMFTKELNGMLFPFRDARGRVVGFIMRNLLYDKSDKTTGVKFVNTDSSCPIFQKGSLLQNLHEVKVRRFSQVYIVEGFWDVLSLRRVGICNAVAPISTAVTTQHVELLRNSGITEIIIALDGDEAGQSCTQKIIDEKFAGCHDLSIKVLDFEGSELDPDEYIREFGGDKFKALSVVDGFEWRLARQVKQNGFDKSRPETIEPLIKLVVNEPSWIKRDGMCETLAKYTKVDISWIRNEVERFTNLKELHIEARRKEIINDMYQEIQSNPHYAEQLMDDAKQKLDDLNEALTNTDPLDPKVLINSIMELKDFNESKGDTLPGMDCGFKTFTEAHGGIRESQYLYAFAGQPNMGKSSFITQLVYNLIKLNPELYVIFHTTDDTLSQVIPRLICIDQHKDCYEQLGCRLILNGVDTPFYYYKKHPEMFEYINKGYANIVDLVRSERLVIKDMCERADAKTIGYGESLIRKMRDRYPSKPVIYVLDNFHKCDDYLKLDERIRYKRMSGKVKDLCQRYHVTGVVSMELNKIYDSREPRCSDLSETGKLEYDVNLLYFLHNAYKVTDGDTKLYWNDHTDVEEVLDANDGNVIRRPKRKPILKGICGKTKVSEQSQALYFKFDPPSNFFEEMTTSEASRLIKRNEDSDGY